MDQLINDVCNTEDLKKFEQKFNTELERGEISSATQFEYACFLVRSKYPADIEKGIHLLEDLYKNETETGKRDYVYYMAIGSARLKDFKMALHYIDGLLQTEPANRQVLDLKAKVENALRINATKGAAIGAAVLAFGGLVGLGFALMSRK